VCVCVCVCVARLYTLLITSYQYQLYVVLPDGTAVVDMYYIFIHTYGVYSAGTKAKLSIYLNLRHT